MARKRHLSRIAVMQTLFEKQTRTLDAVETLVRDIAHLESEFGLVDHEFSLQLLQLTEKNESAVRNAIELYAPEWPLDRMDPISRAILLMSAAEILYMNDAPSAVVINEAIDIAKEFGGAETSKFVNGVLHALAKGAEK